MRKLEEIKSEEWQIFLDSVVKDATFTQITINDMIVDINGIDYTINYEGENVNDFIPLCDPELIIKLYKSNVDITMPLNQLKTIYNEMDNTNAVLFEYAMEVSRALDMYKNSDDIQLKLKEIEKIKDKLK
jgi:hypothetical protein